MVQLVILVSLAIVVLYIVVAGLVGPLGVGTLAIAVLTGGVVCLGGLSVIALLRLRRRRD